MGLRHASAHVCQTVYLSKALHDLGRRHFCMAIEPVRLYALQTISMGLCHASARVCQTVKHYTILVRHFCMATEPVRYSEIICVANNVNVLASCLGACLPDGKAIHDLGRRHFWQLRLRHASARRVFCQTTKHYAILVRHFWQLSHNETNALQTISTGLRHACSIGSSVIKS